MRRLYNVRHVRVCYVEQSEASQCERTEKFCYKKPERATMLEAMSMGDVGPVFKTGEHHIIS